MMGKKLGRIEKIGINFWGFLWGGGVSQSNPKHTTFLFLFLFGTDSNKQSGLLNPSSNSFTSFTSFTLSLLDRVAIRTYNFVFVILTSSVLKF